MARDPAALRLPAPDGFENYWFGAKPHGPAIFHTYGTPRQPTRAGWFISAGDDRGILFTTEGKIRYFSDPQAALEVLLPLLPKGL